MSLSPKRTFSLFVVCLTIAGLVLLAFLLHRQAAQGATMLHSQAAAVAHNIASRVNIAVAGNDRIAVSSGLESFNEFDGVVSIQVMDRREHPLAAVRRNLAGNLSAAASGEIPVVAADPGSSVLSLILGNWTSASIRVPIGEIAPIGWIHLEYDLSPLRETLRRTLLEGLSALLALVAGMSLIFATLARRPTRSLPSA